VLKSEILGGGEEWKGAAVRVFGGLEVLHCYKPHKTGGFSSSRCYKSATKVLQVLQSKVQGQKGKPANEGPNAKQGNVWQVYAKRWQKN